VILRQFLANLFLAVVYMALAGQSGVYDFLIGFAIGWVVVSMYGWATDAPSYTKRIVQLARFACYFVRILIKANLQIAWEIITPSLHQTPRILRYSVEGYSDAEITVLANCITLTPGTLVVDVSDDKRFLYVHCMYAQDENAARAELDELAVRVRREVFAA